MTAPRFEELINRVADRENVPRAVAQAMIDTENPRRDPSLFIRESYGGGSYGLSMVTLKTAQDLGYSGPATGLRDPERNLTYGLRYLRTMFEVVGRGSWTRAVAAYNEGPDIDPWPAALPASTIRHVKRFEGHLARWQRAPGFHPPPVQARTGGWMLLAVVLGWTLPQLLGRRKRQREA